MTYFTTIKLSEIILTAGMVSLVVKILHVLMGMNKAALPHNKILISICFACLAHRILQRSNIKLPWDDGVVVCLKSSWHFSFE